MMSDQNPIPVSKGIRFANFFIDYIVIIIIFIFTGPFLFSESTITDPLLSRLLGVMYFLIYYVTAEALTSGKTIGKLITGTRAVRIDGTRGDFGDFLKRSLSRIIPFEPFSMFGENAWHDSIPGMMVIKDR